MIIAFSRPNMSMEIYYRPEKYGDIDWGIVYSKQMDSPMGLPDTIIRTAKPQVPGRNSI